MTYRGRGWEGALVAFGLFLLLVVVLGLVGAVFVLIVWHIFQLMDLVHINFWQAWGIAILLAGAGGARIQK